MRFSTVKAILATSVSAAMVLSLAGCGRTNSSSSANEVSRINSGKATGSLIIWAMGNEGEVLPKIVKDFEQDNPDVKVKVTSIPWSSAHDKLQTAIAAGNGPDIAQMGVTWMADFSNAFAQVPNNFDMSDFQTGPIDAGKVEGKQYGVPWYVDTRVLYYRTDIAKEAGWNHPPKTWTELKQMAQDMQKVKGVKWGMYDQPSGTDSFIFQLPYAYSAGASLNKGDKWTINTPAMTKAFNFFHSLVAEKIVNPDANTTGGANMQNFVSGDTPMMLEGPTAVSQILQLGGSDFRHKFATATIPAEKAEDKGVSYVGGCDWTVFKDSAHQQTAWKFAQYMSQPKVQAKWYKLSSDLPASKQAWKDKSVASSDKLTAFGEQLNNAKGTPNVTTWAQLAVQGDRMTEQIAKNSISVSDGLKQLQQKADSIGMGK